MKKRKKLLVLGGTRISCEIIKEAHNMGLQVVVADYNSIDVSPGKQIADETILVSVTDVDAVVDKINGLDIDGIITGFSDTLLPYYADICKRTNHYCYGTKELFTLFQNKLLYISLLRKYGIPTIKEYSYDDICKNCDVNYPVIIKPTDNSGSRGLSICYGKEDVDKAIYKAQEYSECNKYIIEEYIEGKEVTVFWVFIDGEYYVTTVGNRIVKKVQGEKALPLPVGYTYPAAIETEYVNKIAPKMKKMFSDLNVQNGMMFIQCKVRDGVCLPYDIGYRLTGSLEYYNLEELRGINPLRMLINYSLSGKMTEKSLHENFSKPISEYAYNVSILAKEGYISRIEGIDKVKRINGVTAVVVEHGPGERITKEMIGLLAQITIRVLGAVEKKELLYEVMNQIHNEIHIISDSGEEMKLPGAQAEDVLEDVL